MAKRVAGQVLGGIVVTVGGQSPKAQRARRRRHVVVGCRHGIINELAGNEAVGTVGSEVIVNGFPLVIVGVERVKTNRVSEVAAGRIGDIDDGRINRILVNLITGVPRGARLRQAESRCDIDAIQQQADAAAGDGSAAVGVDSKGKLVRTLKQPRVCRIHGGQGRIRDGNGGRQQIESEVGIAHHRRAQCFGVGHRDGRNVAILVQQGQILKVVIAGVHVVGIPE